MKKRNGFTLVELMAVIAIMAIIIGIAVPSYIGITKSTNQKTYENKVTEIKIKAEQYASENNIDNATITLQTLINEGYFEIDKAANEEGTQVINPLGGYMDCDLIFISKNDGEYNVTVQENTDRSVSVDDTSSSKINIYAYSYSDTVGESLGSNTNIAWTNKDVLLYADLSKLTLTSNKVTWTTGASTESLDKTITTVMNNNYNDYSNEMLVSARLFLNTEYQVSVETSEGTVTKNVTVKIDKEAPYVDASVNEVWTDGNKETTITGSDGTGSGVDKFYIGTLNKTPSVDDFNIESNNNQAIANLDVGTYYIYSRDVAGNISSPKEVIITNIDKTGPICKLANVPTEFIYSGVSYKWSHEDITLTYGCSDDSASGCSTEDITKTYTDHTHETIYWTISDNVGNKTECSQEVEIKIDKVTPKIIIGQNPISLGTQDYDFKSNISVTYGEASGTTVCTPEYSLKTGTYNITCIATGNNGLITNSSFTARHNYAAPTHQVSYDCSYACNPHDGSDCWTQFFPNTHCGVSGCGTPDYVRHCNTVYDTCHKTCYKSAYYCPYGGSLSGSTCYY